MSYDASDFEEVTCTELTFMGYNDRGNLKIFVAYDTPARDVVIPKSEVQGSDFDESTPVGTEGELVLPRWLAERENLSYRE